jgi:hypothetical protein
MVENILYYFLYESMVVYFRVIYEYDGRVVINIKFIIQYYIIYNVIKLAIFSDYHIRHFIRNK